MQFFQPKVPSTSPEQYELTPAARKLLKELLEAQYGRFLNIPRGAGPELLPPLFRSEGDPNPEPSIPLEDTFQGSLVGELLIHSLGDPNPQPNRVSIINEIIKEKLDVEVVKEMLCELEAGMKILKNELATLEQRGK